ncbi:MAG: hypothetical protein A2X46_05275 [Lentisphaerae bacterium GWF2_57_35]|nr:MAG: hypothetical protein A2X46_05275 [Lentisphaerae bacterium GWF2_57_35]
MLIAKMFFWVGAAGLFYIYAGYPLGVWLLARLWPKPVKKAPYSGALSVVLVAHNEESVLPDKIKSLLNSNRTEQIAEIIVASDGSTDRTVEIVRALDDSRIRAIEFPSRRGKASVLNDIIPLCTNEIVVLTDARQKLHPNALSALVAAFADERVGVVSGALVLCDSGGSAAVTKGIVRYWNYEKAIRQSEGRFSSVPGATGALYAIRKHLFRPIPPNTLVDDVAIPMQIILQGYRCVFEADAVVYDRPSMDGHSEAIRKRRTLAGNLQLMAFFPEWLAPWKNPIWIQFVSHKLARLFTPFLLMLIFAGSLALAWNPLYRGCFLVQLAFYGLVVGAWRAQKVGLKLPGMGFPLAILLFNSAILAAWGDALRGRYEVRWKR